MVGALALNLPRLISLSAVAGLAIAALAVAPGLTSVSSALAQSALEAPPRPDPDGEYGENLPPFDAEGPLLAVVSTRTQQIRVFDKNGMIASSKVSTGRNGYETPEGVFSVIERKVEHNSNLYDDAEMPFMQRITWSGVALHEGVVPGYRASHGCIRLPKGFAERLFRTAKLQTRVVIVPHDGVPQPISHPVLFQPGQLTAKPVPAPSTAPMPDTVPVGEATEDQPMMLGGRLPPSPDLTATDLQPAANPGIAPQVAGPSLTELRSRRVVADRRLADTTKAVEQAKVGVRPRLIEQGKAEKALRQATALANRAEGKAAALGKTALATASDAAFKSAMTSHLEALLELAQARGREEAASEVTARATAAAMSVQDKVKKLEAERQAAQNEARSIARKLSPVTIFVSRQTSRVYVRQATHPVMDLPVTIRDLSRPLGTHVFTALDTDDMRGDQVKWMVVSVDGQGVVPPDPEPPARRRKGEAARAAPAPAAPKHDPLRAAHAALDRVELPDALLARVMPSLQPGSTLIISDLAQSVETGPGTDIVVQTKGEEQAIQNIANFVAKKKAEAAESVSYSPPPRRRDRSGGRYSDWYRW